MSRRARFRSVVDGAATLLCAGATLAALAPLLLVAVALLNGVRALVDAPLRADVGGALLRSLLLAAAVIALAAPAGVALGVRLAAPHRAGFDPLRVAVGWFADVPSVVVGFLLAMLFAPTAGWWFLVASAGALALATLPGIARSTERELRAVPTSLQDAALSLGATPAQALWRVVMPASARAIGAAVVALLARSIGDAAPLAALAHDARDASPLPLAVLTLGVSADGAAWSRAWGAALVLTVIVLLVDFSAQRLLTSRAEVR